MLCALLALAASPVTFHLYAVMFLCAGALLRKNGIGLPVGCWAGLLLICSLIGCFGLETVRTNFFLLFSWVLSIFSVLAGFSRLMPLAGLVQFVAYIGRNSLAILLLHVYFINLFKLIRPVFVRLDVTGLSYVAVVVSATLTGSLLSIFIADKMKFSRWLFGANAVYRPLRMTIKITELAL